MKEFDPIIGYGYRNSEELNHLLETETSAFLNQYYLKAKEILAKNSEFLSKVSDKLLRNRVITMDDIQSLRSENTTNTVELG